jgi:hypothetical protein
MQPTVGIGMGRRGMHSRGAGDTGSNSGDLIAWLELREQRRAPGKPV